MSFAEDEPAVFSAEELLTFDEGQLVEYMKRSAYAKGEFDISSASGIHTMPRHQRDELLKRLNAATRQLESAYDSGSLDISTLLERLAKVASGPDGSSEDTHPQWRHVESQSSARTSPFEGEDIEWISYEELIQNGGRPVVPIEVLSQASREPKHSREKALPWLHDPRSWVRDDRMPIVFTRQVDRWWEFLKWQVDNRGPAVRDDGVSTYLAAQKLRNSLSGSHHMVSNPNFEETVRRMWETRPKLVEVPSNAGFPAYEEAVKRRLASHNFTREFQLEDDPRQQGVWTTWVEYLNFEYWQTDRLAALLKTSEPRYRNAWNDLQRLDTPQPSSLGRVAVSSSQDSSANTPRLEQQLATTQAELKALRQKMDDFIRETRPYRRREEDARCQNILTQWVLEQLHLIEAEAAQEPTAVKSDQGNALPSKKRRRTENKEAKVKNIPAERRSKRLRRSDASGGGTAQHSAPGRPESSSKATISTDMAATTPKRVAARQLRGPRQVADQQRNANPASQRSQRSSQRSHATAGQSASLGLRRSKRLQARSQPASERIT